MLWIGGYVATCLFLIWIAGLPGVAIGLAVGLIFYVCAGLSPRELKITASAVLGLIILLASLKVYDYAKNHKWSFAETSNAALLPKPKTEAEKLVDAVRRIENRVDAALENITAVSDALDDFKKEVEEKFSYDRGRLDALSQDDYSAAPSLQAPPNIASPTFKWVPALPKTKVPDVPPEPAEEEEKPKGVLLPNTAPKEPLPELRAKIPAPQKKTAFPKKLVCDCGHVHDIEGWDDLKNGSYMPCYKHCVDPITGLACDVRDYEKVVQK